MTPHIPVEPDANAGEPAESGQTKRDLLAFFRLIIWFVLIFVGLKLFVIEMFEVSGPSMEPSLRDGERILVYKLPQTLRKIGLGGDAFSPGDIIVFQSNGYENRRYIKRIIAEGPLASRKSADAASEDRQVSVRVEDQDIYVNNHRIDEPYLPEVDAAMALGEDQATLEPGMYYVLGDNRVESRDSRKFGPVPENKIIGHAVFRFWPLSRFGRLTP